MRKPRMSCERATVRYAPITLPVPPEVDVPLRKLFGAYEFTMGDRGPQLKVMRDGAATLVIDLDGHHANGVWNVGVYPSPTVPREKAHKAARTLRSVLRQLDAQRPEAMSVLRDRIARANAPAPAPRVAALLDGDPFPLLRTQRNDAAHELLRAALLGDRAATLRAFEGLRENVDSTLALHLDVAIATRLCPPATVAPKVVSLDRRNGGDTFTWLLLQSAEQAARDKQAEAAKSLVAATLPKLQVANANPKHAGSRAQDLAHAARVLSLVGQFRQARTLAEAAYKIDPTSLSAARVLAGDMLARGKFERALKIGRGLITDHPDNVLGLEVTGAALAGLGRDAEAKHALQQVLTVQRNSVVANMWLAMLAERANDPRAASEYFETGSLRCQRPLSILGVLITIQDHELDIAEMMEELGLTEPPPLAAHDPATADLLRRPAAQSAMFKGIFEHDAALWTSPEALEHALDNNENLKAFARTVIRQFEGNFAAPLSFYDRENDRRRPVADTPDSRTESGDALKKLRYLSPEEVRQELVTLGQKHPDSPHPGCYLGELLLWSGEYDAAVASFHEARERFPARWSFVGCAAAHLLMGQRAQADIELAACHQRYPPLDAATTAVYVGEFERRDGRLDTARNELTRALNSKPSRHGARMNLALIDLAEGHVEAAEKHNERLWSALPGLLYEAASQCGLSGDDQWAIENAEQVFETAMTMMRGNRSSSIVTYWVDDGFRVAPKPAQWLNVADMLTRLQLEQTLRQA